MARILLPAGSRLRPMGPAEIDDASPLTNGLVFFVCPGGHNRLDYVNRTAGTLIGSNAVMGGAVPRGPALQTTDAISGMAWPFPRGLLTITTQATIVTWAKIVTDVGFAHFVATPSGTGWSTPYVNLSFERETAAGGTTMNFVCNIGGVYTKSGASSINYWVVGSPLTMYAVSRNGTAVVFYKNGSLVNTTTFSTAAATTWTNPQPIAVNQRSSTNVVDAEGFIGLQDYVAIWSRALTPSEIAWLYADPYRLLRPIATRAWLRPSVAQAVAGRRYLVSQAVNRSATY